MASDRIITVFGSSRHGPGTAEAELAADVGAELARHGYMLCNGGYGGTMEAAAEAAKAAGGRTIGVTCEIFAGVQRNRWIDREIRTPTMYARVEKLVEIAAAFVALPGGTGTLVELACVWELLNKHLVAPRPLILMGDYWRPLVEIITPEDPHAALCVAYADTAADVIARLREAEV